jgi:uncharacterized Zn-finger protein
MKKSTDEQSATSEELLHFLKDLSEFEYTENPLVLPLYPDHLLEITRAVEFNIVTKVFICTSCKKSFKNHYKLEKHNKLHFCEKNFKCTYQACGKVYKSKENLTLHIKNKHLGMKPYKCKYCDHLFSHRNGKIYHERKFHKDEMSFQCLGKVFFVY